MKRKHNKKPTLMPKCITCGHCVMQVDDNLYEHFACLIKSTLNTIDLKTKLYYQLQYEPHKFTELENQFFATFRTHGWNTCSQHTHWDT